MGSGSDFSRVRRHQNCCGLTVWWNQVLKDELTKKHSWNCLKWGQVESEDALVYSDHISSSKDPIKPHSHVYCNPDFIRMLSSVTVCVNTNVRTFSPICNPAMSGWGSCLTRAGAPLEQHVEHVVDWHASRRINTQKCRKRMRWMTDNMSSSWRDEGIQAL